MLVTVPEETPVNELVETAFAIEDRAGVALGPDRRERLRPADSTGCDARRPRRRRAAGVASRAPSVDDARRARPRSALDLDARQARAAARGSAERLPLPQITLPFFFTAEIGPAEIELLADAFTAGVDALEPVGR